MKQDVPYDTFFPPDMWWWSGSGFEFVKWWFQVAVAVAAVVESLNLNFERIQAFILENLEQSVIEFYVSLPVNDDDARLDS